MSHLDKLTSLCGNAADGFLLTSAVARRYAAESGIAEGIAVISAAGSRYFTDSRYIEAAEKQLKGFEVIMTDRAHPYLTLINSAIDDFGIKSLGFEDSDLSYDAYTRYNDGLHADLVPCQKALEALRWSKEDWELNLMLRAQEITDTTFSELLSVIRPGMSEKELCAELIYRLLKHGADGLSFDPIVVSGPNTSLPHGVPGERLLQNGDFITMDFGCLVDGYCSDMTRTVALGSATEKMREVYNVVAEAQKAGISVSAAGIAGSKVDGAARKVIEAAGYGAFFGHSYGHSLGLEIHEDPNCSPYSEVPMPVNSICSAEPGIYLPGEFGVRIEDVCIFKEDGVVDITRSPKELIII